MARPRRPGAMARFEARQGPQIVVYGDSRGEAAVTDTSARVSGRESR